MPGKLGLQAQSCCCSAKRWDARLCSRDCGSVSTHAARIGKRFHGSSMPSRACRGPLSSGSCRPRASRDPDRVSTLSADEAALNSADAAGGSTKAYQQQQQQAVQTALQDQRADPEPTAAAASTVSNTPGQLDSQSSSQHSGSSSGHHSKVFAVTVQQLRQLVQAGVDDSQFDAAAAVIQTLAEQLQEKQELHRQRKQQKAADGAAAGSSGSLGSLGSLGSSGSLASISNGKSSSNGAATVSAAATAAAAASGSLAVLPRALASALGSSLSSGLSGSKSDVAARVAAFGSNSLAAAATSSFWQLLLEAASDSTLMLLMAAGAVSLGLAASTGKEAVDYIDGAAILASVAICVTVTAVTNYQKEAKFRQLNNLKENIPVRHP